MRHYPFFLAVLLIAFLAIPARAQSTPREPLLATIGGGNIDVAPILVEAAIHTARQGKVNILILPINLASDSLRISDAERDEILASLEVQRKYLEQVCQSTAPKTLLCTVAIAPILTRKDASDPDNLGLFTQDLAAIYLPDGTRAVGVDVIGGTPLEYQLSRLYDQGVIVAGNGAGGVMEANPMIGNITQKQDPSDALNFGAVQVWDTAEQHGLLFGIKHALIEDQFFQEGKPGWLLNAISMPNIPNVGIGFDDNTGAMIPSGDKLQDVFGEHSITILDAETYHSADAVKYTGANNLISLRNVLVHTLAPGEFSYDLVRNHHSLGAPYQQLTRDFDSLVLPPDAGPLVLTGDLARSPGREMVVDRFIQLSGGSQADVLVLTGGYPTQIQAEQAGAEIAKMLKADTRVSVVTNTSALPSTLAEGYDGIILSIADPGRIEANTLIAVKEAWMLGVPILADNGTAALFGNFYVPPTVLDENGERTTNTEKTLSIREEMDDGSGLGVLNANFVTRVMEDNRWGELFSLAYRHPDLLSIGLSQNSAIEIDHDGAQALGNNSTFVMDFRNAVLDKGENNNMIVANGLLDVYAPGQSLVPEQADINAAPHRLATPALITPSATPQPTQTSRPTITPTVSSTPTQSPVPTKRVKPTSTPIIIPPPSDPLTRTMMLILGVSIVLVIIFGIWINRHRIL